MTSQLDYVVVGAGITGSTIARLLCDAGKRVLIVDRRNHRGGNVHDSVHECGVRIHTYGPHYFRCNSERIWDFVRRFSAFHPYEARVKTLVNGRLENWPVDAKTIESISPGWQPGPTARVTNFEEACLARMPREIYEQFVAGYTEKQWGCSPRLLDKALATRIHINTQSETRLTPAARYQGLPSDGYSTLMQRMVDGIETWLNFDFLSQRHAIPLRPEATVVFTGPLDEYFGFDLGRLAYRGQRRVHRFFAEATTLQPCAQVNYPDRDPQNPIRTIEWKHLMPESCRDQFGSVITSEHPHDATNPNDYEYPFPDAMNRALYERYAARARHCENVIFCGRLAEYRYLDMDQAIGRAMMLADKLLARASVNPSDGVPRSQPIFQSLKFDDANSMGL